MKCTCAKQVVGWVVGLVGWSDSWLACLIGLFGLFDWLVVGLVVFVGSIHVQIFDL